MSKRLRLLVLVGGAALTGSLLALAFGDDTQPPALPPGEPAAASLPPSAPASVASVAGAAPLREVTSPPAPLAVAQPPAAASASPRPASGPGSLEYQALVESRLTRRLQGAHPLRIDGAEMEILGTQLPREGREEQPYLAVRNVLTGEVAYWQSGLRIALRPGIDPETFIAQQTELRRLFVNSQFAEVAVDAAAMSAVHARLLADPRVRGVRLLPISKRPTLR